MLVDGLDAKQRKQLDSDLNGWGEMNDRATKALWEQRESGGES